MNQQWKYYAFISYKREDEKWAKWLQHKLEHYRLPSNLNGRNDLPREIRPIFRDTSELNPGNLPQQIHDALSASHYLIVICSPHSAQSKWVNLEIESFIAMGKRDCIIPFIIDGSPFANNPKEECFPLAIRNLPKEQELLGANINEMGRDAAAVKTVAKMFGLRFDTLWQRFEREQRRKRFFVILALVLFTLAVMGVAAYIWRQNTLIAQSRSELLTAYNNLSVANKETEQERDRANQEKERAEMAEDSIRMQYEIIKLERDKTQQALWSTMENRARFIAEKGQELIDDHDYYTARLLALSILPKSLEHPDKPYVVEAEILLRNAMQYDGIVFRGHTDHSYAEYKGSWPPDDYEEWEVLWGVNDKILHIAFSPDGKRFLSVSGMSNGNTLCIWEAQTGKMIAKYSHNSSPGAAFSPDGKKIVAVIGDEICILNAVTGKKEKEIGIVDGAEYADGFLWPNSNQIVGYVFNYFDTYNSTFSTKFKIFDLLQKQWSESRFDSLQIGDFMKINAAGDFLAYTDKMSDYELECTAYSHDGTRIATGASDSTVRIWDIATGTQLTILKGHSDRVSCVAFSPDGKYIASGSWDGTVRIWDLRNRMGEGILIEGDGAEWVSVDDIAINPDSKKLKALKLLSEEGYQDIPYKKGMGIGKLLEGPYFPSNNVAMSTDGKKIVVYDYMDEMVIRDAQTGEQIGETLEGHTEYVRCASFSPDGKRIISGSMDSTIRIWDATTGKQIGKTLKGHRGAVNSVAFSPEGNRIVSASDDSTVRIWDAATGNQIGKSLRHSGVVWEVSFSPDGKQLISLSEDLQSFERTTRIWDAATGKLLGIKEHYPYYSSDGKRFVTDLNDGSVCVWDAVTGKQLSRKTLQTATNARDFSIHPDGRYLLTWSRYDYVQLWDAESGIKMSEPFENGGQSAIFSPDGRKIAIGGDNGVFIFDFPPLQEMIDQTRRRFKDCQLTPNEKKRYYLE